MDNPFDRYDTHAVFIPGLITVLLGLYMHYGSLKAVAEALPADTFSSSLLIIIIGYFVGEVLQSFCRVIEWLIWTIHVCDPLGWVFIKEDRYSWRVRFFRKTPERFISEARRVRLLGLLAKERNGDMMNDMQAFTKNEMYACYDIIKKAAYENEICREGCSKMLAKSGMYASFLCSTILLWLLQNVPYFCTHPLFSRLYAYTGLPELQFPGTIPNFCFPVVGLFFLWRYRFFNIRYNQRIIFGYLEARADISQVIPVIEKEDNEDNRNLRHDLTTLALIVIGFIILASIISGL